MFLGPNTFGALSIDVSVKLPKPLTNALKTLPDIRAELKQYAVTGQKDAEKGFSTANALNVTLETLGVAAVFGGIVIALLVREKGKKS